MFPLTGRHEHHALFPSQGKNLLVKQLAKSILLDNPGLKYLSFSISRNIETVSDYLANRLLKYLDKKFKKDPRIETFLTRQKETLLSLSLRKLRLASKEVDKKVYSKKKLALKKKLDSLLKEGEIGESYYLSTPKNADKRKRDTKKRIMIVLLIY